MRNAKPLLYTHLLHDARLVQFALGEITLRWVATPPRDVQARIADCLSEWTRESWKIKSSDEPGDTSLHEQLSNRKKDRLEAAKTHKLVAAVLTQFPGAEVTDVIETKE